MTKILDSNGVEIRPGDIVECPEVDKNSAWRYHICSIWRLGDEPEIRDLGHNNLGTYDSVGPFYNIGHFTKHLDKLGNDAIVHYFNIDLETLRVNRCKATIEEIEE